MSTFASLGFGFDYDEFARWVKRGSWILQFSHNVKHKLHFVMCSRCNYLIHPVSIPEMASLVVVFDGYPFLCDGCEDSIVRQWQDLITLDAGDRNVL